MNDTSRVEPVQQRAWLYPTCGKSLLTRCDTASTRTYLHHARARCVAVNDDLNDERAARPDHKGQRRVGRQCRPADTRFNAGHTQTRIGVAGGSVQKCTLSTPATTSGLVRRVAALVPSIRLAVVRRGHARTRMPSSDGPSDRLACISVPILPRPQPELCGVDAVFSAARLHGIAMPSIGTGRTVRPGLRRRAVP